MTIAELRDTCKRAVSVVPRDLLIFFVLIVSALFTFGLGYLAGLEAAQMDGLSVVSSPLITTLRDERVVASEGGTKYFLAWCGGADRISAAHRVWFPSAKEAEAAGYSPAANCSGL